MYVHVCDDASIMHMGITNHVSTEAMHVTILYNYNILSSYQMLVTLKQGKNLQIYGVSTACSYPVPHYCRN